MNMKLMTKFKKLRSYNKRKKKDNVTLITILKWLLVLVVFTVYVLTMVIVDSIECISVNTKVLLHIMLVYILITVVRKIL